jgi:DNA-binding transcriptional LysR family regulator
LTCSSRQGESFSLVQFFSKEMAARVGSTPTRLCITRVIAVLTKRVPLEQLDWDNLRVFLAVARTGNLQQAARRLRLDQSTVSRRIVQFESTLNAKVLARQAHGVDLNDLGHKILRYAEAMDATVVALRDGLHVEGAAPGGSVRLATMEGIASMHLARFIPAFIATHPDIHLELVVTPQHVDLNRRDADVLLSFVEPRGSSLQIERLGEFYVDLYGSAEYLARAGTPATKADLAQHKFVTYIEDLIQFDAVRWLDDLMRQRDAVFTSSSLVAQTTAAANGAGLVLLPRFAASRVPALVRVNVADVHLTRSLWMSVHDDLHALARVQAVTRFVRSLIASDGEHFVRT